MTPPLGMKTRADLAGDARRAELGRRIGPARLDRRVRVAGDGADAAQLGQHPNQVAERPVQAQHAVAAERRDQLGLDDVEPAGSIRQRDERISVPEPSPAPGEVVARREREEPVHRE